MSEVKRISVFMHGPNKKIDMVEAVHLDRVNAEHDAQIAALKAGNEYAVRKCQELQSLLTAADDRADVLEGLLAKYYNRSDVCAFMAKDIGATLKTAEVQRNQCDGCQAGVPVVNGAHRMGKPGGYADTMSCTAKMYVEERPDGCCCPPKGHTGLWGAAMCPVHQGLRALKR